MNCQLCKYRTQIVGYEGAAGAPQAGHHHHVRGIGAGDGHDHHHYRSTVMPGLDPGIHAPATGGGGGDKSVEGRDEPGHDAFG